MASLGIRDGDQVWLVDATPSLPDQLHVLTEAGQHDLAGILLTHGHMGHYTGLLHLGREVMGADDVPVYAMPRMAGLLTGSEPWALLGRLNHIEVTLISSDTVVPLSDRVKATPFLVPHRDELTETVGWRIEGPERSIAWLPDIDKWSKWDTPVEELIASVDVAFLDATFYADGEVRRDISEVPHPFVVETLARLKDRPELLKKVRLVHLKPHQPAAGPEERGPKGRRQAGAARSGRGRGPPAVSGRVALVDGTGMAFRAFHALPGSMCTPSGEPTNAIYGFATMLRKVFAGRRVTHMAVVFDAPGGTFRHTADPTYKAHRPPMPRALAQQLPGIEDLVRAHGVPVVKVSGVEADDVIGTLAVQAREEGHDVWIVSPDKDFAQLVGPGIRQLDTGSDVLMDADRVRRRHGVTPERFVDWLALVGDQADGIRGVPGIGRTGAAELLKDHTLDELLDDPPAGKAGERLRTHADKARASRELARLRTDVPLGEWLANGLDDLTVGGPDLQTLNRAYRRFAFHSLLAPEAIAPTDGGAVQYFVADSAEMAAGAIEHETTGDDPVAVHVLVELDGPRRHELLGLAISPRRGRAVYLPFAGPGGLGPIVLRLARPWLESPRPKVLHHAKEAIRTLSTHGIALRGVVGDGALGSYLLDPTRHLPHRLDQVARDQLHVALQPIYGLLGKGRDRVGFFDLTVDRSGAWACHMADAAGAVWERMAPRLVQEALDRELQAVDLPLAHVLAAMEARGIGANVARLEDLEKAFAAERRHLAQQIHAAAGRRFTIGSGKQLGTVLFDELGLPVQGRTKTGYKTDVAVLRKLRDLHPIVPLVQRHKVLDTLVQTYTKPLRARIGPDGRIHPTYVCTSSASGRILTTEPDLQRTPIATDESAAIREALVAADGHVLVRADWSQLELRLLAHLAQDRALIEAYRRGEDVHVRTAAALLGLQPAQVSAEDREVGKAVNYATIYGQGPQALGEQLDLPASRARAFIEAFFQAWPGVAAWRDRTIVEAHTHGFVTTFAGRRRYLPELTHRDRADQAYGERAALNTPIQGSGADLCKRALLMAHRDLPRGAGLVLQVHDELLVECRPEQVSEVTSVLRRAMEEVAELDVPLPVSVGVGRTWRAAHDAG